MYSKKLMFIAFSALLFVNFSSLLIAQNNSILSDNYNMSLFVGHSNIDDGDKSNHAIFLGFNWRQKDGMPFWEMSFSGATANNHTDIKGGLNVNAGVVLEMLNKSKTEFRFNFVGGAGVCGMRIKDSLKKEDFYFSPTTFMGMELGYNKFLLSVRYYPKMPMRFYTFETSEIRLSYCL